MTAIEFMWRRENEFLQSEEAVAGERYTYNIPGYQSGVTEHSSLMEYEDVSLDK